MGWQHVSFDWNQARAFLATVEEGSFSGAARVLGLTQPTLGRQVANLEEELGVVLFKRVRRTVRTTPFGLELVGDVRAMRDAAHRVSLLAAGRSHTIGGRVAITASDIPEIDLIAVNDVRDLLNLEADIAIRHVRPSQPDLIARLVPEATAYLHASTDYLETHGRPGSADELAGHEFVTFGDVEGMVGYLNGIGIPVTATNFRIGSANGLVAWEMVRQGLGISPTAELVGRTTPGVERVLPDKEQIVFPVWLTTHRELHSSASIRLVFDTLADYLGSLGR